jgi:hypothetical protein
VTDKEIREGNVRQLAECGKAGWKIENEHNNVLGIFNARADAASGGGISEDLGVIWEAGDVF